MEAASVAPVQQHAARRPAFEVELQAIEDYRRFAALTIQRYYRGWIVRLHKSRQVRWRHHCTHPTLQHSPAYVFGQDAARQPLHQAWVPCLVSENLSYRTQADRSLTNSDACRRQRFVSSGRQQQHRKQRPVACTKQLKPSRTAGGATRTGVYTVSTGTSSSSGQWC
jgi:hypothetical protein